MRPEPQFFVAVPRAVRGRVARTEAASILLTFCNMSIMREKLRSMSELQRITINPNQCGGRPCVRGMRIRVKDVLDMLAGGATQEEILRDFPDLEAEDIRACIAYVARYLDHTILAS